MESITGAGFPDEWIKTALTLYLRRTNPRMVSRINISHDDASFRRPRPLGPRNSKLDDQTMWAGWPPSGPLFCVPQLPETGIARLGIFDRPAKRNSVEL
jgi:hypothetical protein